MIKILKLAKSELIKNANVLCDLTSAAMNSSYSIEINEEDREKWLKSFYESLNNNVNFLVCVDKEIQGYISWITKEQDLYINDLMIHPKYQKNGVTLKNIIKEFKLEISGTLFENIIVYTNNNNNRMISIFSKVGFIIAEETSRGKIYKISKNDFFRILSSRGM